MIQNPQLSLFRGKEYEPRDRFPDDDFLDFVAFHNQNPKIYRIFEMAAVDHARTRKKKMGARMIIDRIRFGMERQGMNPVTISNNCIAYYTRMFLRDHREYIWLFDTRPLKNVANEHAITEIH